MAHQSTLDNFFKLTKKRRTYFYLTQNAKTNTLEAQWLLDCPSYLTFQASVYWKELKYPIIVCTNQIINPYTIPSETLWTYMPFLKSNLQKSIRRQLVSDSVATAWHMIKLDLEEILRRLPIIMMEDVQIHESISVLIWMISAVSKGYKLSQDQIEWILGVVQELCCDSKADYLDHFPSKTEMIKPEISQHIRDLEQNNILSEAQRNLLYSLYFRYSYGGTSGDMRMVYNYAQLWHSRYPEQRAYHPNVKPYSLDGIVDLVNPELASADFHCFPQMLQTIRLDHPQLSLFTIRECIWHCSSKTNYRKLCQIDPKLKEIWKEIGPTVQSLQTHLITRNQLI